MDDRPAAPSSSDRVFARARRLMKSEILTGRPDPEGLLALANAVFPGDDLADPRYVIWLYDRNPSGRALELISRNRDLLTGHIAIVPHRYKIGAASALGSMAVNAITHPDYRGRGIFIILHDAVFKMCPAEGIAFTFGYANLSSEKGCLRHLGYRELLRLPLWVLPLDLGRIVAAVPSRRGLAWRTAAAAAQPLAQLWRGIRRPRGTRAVSVERIREFGPEFDEFWEAVAPGYGNILVRNREFLDWRFVRLPTREYELFAARADGRLVGYLAGRTTSIEGLRWAMIVDLLAENSLPGRGAAARLVAAYHRHVLDSGADIAAALMVKSAPVASALRCNGYVVCPPSLLPREFPALLHWNLSAPPPADVFDSRAWFITLADYDAV